MEKIVKGKIKYTSFFLALVFLVGSLMFVAQMGINAFAWNPEEEYRLVYITNYTREYIEAYLTEGYFEDDGDDQKAESIGIWRNIMEYAEQNEISYGLCNEWDQVYRMSPEIIIYDPWFTCNNPVFNTGFDAWIRWQIASGYLQYNTTVIANGKVYDFSDGFKGIDLVPSGTDASYYLGFSYVLQGFENICIIEENYHESEVFHAMANGAAAAAGIFVGCRINIYGMDPGSETFQQDIMQWFDDVGSGVIYMVDEREYVFEAVCDGYSVRGYNPFDCPNYPLIAFKRSPGELKPLMYDSAANVVSSDTESLMCSSAVNAGPFTVVNACYWLLDKKFCDYVIDYVVKYMRIEFINPWWPWPYPPDRPIIPPMPKPDPMWYFDDLITHMKKYGLDQYRDMISAEYGIDKLSIEMFGITAQTSILEEQYSEALTTALLTKCIDSTVQLYEYVINNIFY